MSKSIKFTNDTYLDSSGIVFEKISLDKILAYSTEEQIVGRWYDGKIRYRKTIIFPNGTGTTTNKAYLLNTFNINNVNEIFVSIPSFYMLNGYGYPFPYYDGNKFAIYVSPTELHIELGYERISNSKVVVTLEYTKTTD